MVQFSFTGLGSLIHPFFMAVLVPSWITTWVLGIMVRQSRLTPPQGEETPMLQEDIRSISRQKRYHHKLSSSLLLLTYFFMLVGLLNTYLRSGRLFPSAHMYGGFWFILLLTMQTALVPWLADVKFTRIIHAVVGLITIGVLLNQVWSSWSILSDVWAIVFP